VDFQLEAYTSAGEQFVALAEHHAIEVAARAGEHDQEGTFPFEAIESMKASGYLTATVPEEFGGLGLTSARDLGVGVGRLARGDGSIAIATNMHLVATTQVARRLGIARSAGADDSALVTVLGLIAAGTIAMANISEAGTDVRHPLTTATPTEGGWLLNGRKIFGTLSPVADVFFVSCRTAITEPSPEQRRLGDEWQSHFAPVFTGSDGVTMLDDWNALGMRGSGSGTITYENVFIADGLLTPPAVWGREDLGTIESATGGNIGLVGAFLGIAERAQQLAIHMAKNRTKAPSGRSLATRHGIQRLIAESEIDLTVCRSLLGHVGRLIDRVIVNTSPGTVSLAEMQAVGSQWQSAKYEINRRAIDVVDRAMTVSGGAGYLASNELSRLYRDVRAGPFMQPYSPNEAHEYIGKIVLGLEPFIDG
jgi:alkylation response protein AidB-like acyl-CoA dehydrogenase